MRTRTWITVCGWLLLSAGALACTAKDDGTDEPVGADVDVGGGGVGGNTTAGTGSPAASAGASAVTSAGRAGSSTGTGGAPAAGTGSTTAAGAAGLGTAGAPIAGSAGAAAGGGGGASAPIDLAPIEPPVASGCIDDVSAGDHTFTCGGIPFLTMIDAQCTTNACGLIMDVHGATMTGAVMRMNNRLHELAPPKGYIAVAPTEPGGAWDFPTQMPILADFIDQMIAAFHLNTRRIHVTGFSMGSGATFWFLCNRPDLIASAGPVTGASASQITVESSGMPCIESLDGDWQPRIPILFMSGTLDSALTAEAAQARTDTIVTNLGLTGGDEIDGDGSYRRKRWTGADGMVFDFLTHDYSGVVAGHCIPGPTPDLIYGCTSGNVALDWGQTVLDWFVEHPKP
jgi:pimeloyl-ACP methyl ester carboxylesterase